MVEELVVESEAVFTGREKAVKALVRRQWLEEILDAVWATFRERVL